MAAKNPPPLSLELLNKYFTGLVSDKFYGVIEVTLQGGELVHAVERRSRPAFEIGADVFKTSEDEELKARIQDKFDGDGKFRKRAGLPIG
jgi:hypothetical protein